MNTILKKLAIGEQSIKNIIEQDYLYIDKTEYIYKIITESRYYFLSRPRRFGKSLLISTLKEIFLGNKELFKDCWIYNTDYNWKIYPVIHIDFSESKEDENASFYERFFKQLKEIPDKYEINVNENNLSDYFRKLIIELFSKYGRVVILIDEYDKPILDHITELERANTHINILRNLFEIIKKNGELLRFVFITGITRFAKISLFSGLNNLDDISNEKHYASLLGYTQEELEFYFKDRINSTSLSLNTYKEKLLTAIKHWYNGYRFTEDNNLTVYNPFSIVNFFKKEKFGNDWAESGNPSFLIQLIQKNQYSVIESKDFKTSILSLNTFDIENIDFITLLFQAGYLTIESFNEKNQIVTLRYPNYEIEQTLTERIVDIIDKDFNKKLIGLSDRFIDALNNHGIDGLIKEIQILIAGVSYFHQLKKESYYLSMALIMFKMIGFNCFTEVSMNYGRIDLMFSYLNNIYIFEFKLNESAIIALNQIKAKNYYKSYLNLNKNLYLIGININFKDKEEKNINEWIVEKVKN